jgi:FkbM family methyltransferase
MSKRYERVASAMVGTPLQTAAERLRDLKHAYDIRREPGLRNVLQEGHLTQLLMKRYIEADTCCIDVGCHLGVMLHQMVTLAPGGTHHAFEPVPYKAAWLWRKFPTVTVHQLALSDHDSVDQFYVNNDSSALSALRPAEGTDVNDAISVETRCLDDVVPDDLPIGFVKIDAIGAEPLVMKGADRLLRKHRPMVLFESSQASLGYFDLTASMIYDYLVDDLGYQLLSLHGWSVGHPPLDRAGLDKAMEWPYEAFNFLAMPSEERPSAA